jgi:hypothetical protein
LKIGMGSLGPKPDKPLDLVVTDNIVLNVEPLSAVMANTVLCIFFWERLSRSFYSMDVFPVCFSPTFLDLVLPCCLSVAL